MKILYVEDQDDLRELMVKRLKRDYSIDTCGDGESALDYLRVYTYDLVILDIMLPKLSGIEILKWMRQKGIQTPVLFLSAKGDIEDRVTGLDAGADDYLVKPFSFEELRARIRVLVRRKGTQLTSELKVGSLIMDTARHTVSRDGISISLTSKEFQLLEYMMHHPGIILTRSQLENNAWDSSFEGGSNVVDVYIRYLRKKIDDKFSVKMIQTVRGSGYCLKSDI